MMQNISLAHGQKRDIIFFMGTRIKKKRCKRRRLRRFHLLKPIELYALLITVLAAVLSIVLIESSREYRQHLKLKAKKAVYGHFIDMAREEKKRYLQLKEDGKAHVFYDSLTAEQKETLKKEYESLKKMDN